MRIFDRDCSLEKEYMDGTHRSRRPADTLAAYSRWLAPLGITRLADVTGLDRVGIPVCLAIRPNSRSLSVSQGKGADKTAAKVSAMMESIELWHAENIENRLRLETLYAMRKSCAIVAAEALPIRAGRVLRDDLPMLWMEGWDLIQQRATWVPFEYVSMNTLCFSPEMTYCVSSNGLASGNHLLEAIEHALCELIERDATALKHLEPSEELVRCKVDPASVEDPLCRSFIERFRAADIEIAIWDITSDISIPTYEVMVIEPDRPRWRALGQFSGFGTHPSPNVALSRALTEAAQGRLTIIAGSRDDNPYKVYAADAAEQRV
ncbi:MAG TPA: YcaO-like family protein, partial [Polyangiaceae bacterium]|nr:YcaO-like family protein [Polyangiaceae bacterium]